jgi:hypothetical protein
MGRFAKDKMKLSEQTAKTTLSGNQCPCHISQLNKFLESLPVIAWEEPFPRPTGPRAPRALRLQDSSANDKTTPRKSWRSK